MKNKRLKKIFWVFMLFVVMINGSFQAYGKYVFENIDKFSKVK